MVQSIIHYAARCPKAPRGAGCGCAQLKLQQSLRCFSLYFSDSPRITLAPTDQKVAENGIISFFCKASGNPAPDIHWKKNSKRISANRQR